jgi:pentatricopeptide repeat domain-containing protein 1
MLFSILRRSYGAAVILNNNKKKFPPLTRFVSSSILFPDFDYDPLVIELNALDVYDDLSWNGVTSISDYNRVFSILSRIGAFYTLFKLIKELEEPVGIKPYHRPIVFPDVHTWDILIECHSKLGNMSSAFSLFRKIIDTGYHPTTQNLNHLLRGFCDKHEIHNAMLFYNGIILKKGFQLNCDSYYILINGLCEIGETQTAIQLLRKALEIDKKPKYSMSNFMCCYNSIIFRLCKDRLVNQAYELYSEMIHVNNIKPDSATYKHLIYGYCILGQFKQALRLFIEFEASRIVYLPTPPTLVTEHDVKSAKSVAAVMIKGGVKPNVASYHSVIDGLYKSEGGSRSVVMNKIAQKVEMLLLSKPDMFNVNYD